MVMKNCKIIAICVFVLFFLAGGAYAQKKVVKILAIGNSF